MKSKYANVYCPNPRDYRKKSQWRARIKINGETYDQYYKTEREAALAIDNILIRHGKAPVNVLNKAK